MIDIPMHARRSWHGKKAGLGGAGWAFYTDVATDPGSVQVLGAYSFVGHYICRWSRFSWYPSLSLSLLPLVLLLLLLLVLVCPSRRWRSNIRRRRRRRRRELGASLCSSLDVRCGSPAEKQQQGQFVEYLSLLEGKTYSCVNTRIYRYSLYHSCPSG
jgi:hypothetical protein